MNHSDPYIFSRGSLKLTFDLLRTTNPSLALIVRNIISLPPLPKLEGDVNSQITDCFLIELDSVQVSAIVEALLKRSHVTTQANAGTKVVAEALIEDWALLGLIMIEKLANNR